MEIPANDQSAPCGSREAGLVCSAICLLGLAFCLAPASFAQQPPFLPVPNACRLPSGPPPCKDSDGDGLCDSWEHAKRLPDGTPLPDADPDKPDVYVRYDWMGYGRADNACTTDATCSTTLGLGHAGETCSGPPVPGSAHSCAYACTTDTDCTSRGPAGVQGSHVGDRCIQNVCQHTHDPELIAPAALEAVVESFARHGINLHILRGSEVPHSHVLSFRLLDDATYPSNTMTDTCEGGSLAAGSAGMGQYAESFYDLKSRFFDPRQLPAYHYAIFGHYSSCDTTGHCLACPSALNPDGTEKNSPTPGQSGIAEIWGNDFIVSLGNRINDIALTPSIFDVGSTFMHELGHNLGLHHGGGVNIPCTTAGSACPGGFAVCTAIPSAGENYCLEAEDIPDHKPNYLSVMNYLYQFTGITRGDAVGSSTPAPCSVDADCLTGEHCRSQFGCARLDYSSQTLPTGGNTPGKLDENGNLNEPAGLGSGNADLFRFHNGNCDATRWGPTQGPVDFDGDGFADNTHATADLDSFQHACPSVFTILIGHTDWGPALGQSVFLYNFQCSKKGKD